jgi:hypothetical protein
MDGLVCRLDAPQQGWVGEIQQTSEEESLTAGEIIHSISGQPIIRFMSLEPIEIGGLSFEAQ